MMNFIVLGLIPGTHLQITFKWILSFVAVVLIFVLILSASDMVWLRNALKNFTVKIKVNKFYISKGLTQAIYFLRKVVTLRV